MAKLTKCPNGHFYDPDRSPQCPYCDGRSEAPPMPPADGAETGKTAPLQEEAMSKTQPLNGAGVDRTRPLDDAGTNRTVPLAGAGAPVRQGNWQRMLLRIALAAAVFAGLFTVYGCAWYMSRWSGHTGELLGTSWYGELLIDLVCCVVTCLCCVWCLRARGARPGLPLSIVLAAADIGLTLYECRLWFRSISAFGLSRTIKSLRAYSTLLNAEVNVLCLIAAILAWAAIFLYRRKQKQNKNL